MYTFLCVCPLPQHSEGHDTQHGIHQQSRSRQARTPTDPSELFFRKTRGYFTTTHWTSTGNRHQMDTLPPLLHHNTFPTTPLLLANTPTTYPTPSLPMPFTSYRSVLIINNEKKIRRKMFIEELLIYLLTIFNLILFFI